MPATVVKAMLALAIIMITEFQTEHGAYIHATV